MGVASLPCGPHWRSGSGRFARERSQKVGGTTKELHARRLQRRLQKGAQMEQRREAPRIRRALWGSEAWRLPCKEPHAHFDHRRGKRAILLGG